MRRRAAWCLVLVALSGLAGCTLRSRWAGAALASIATLDDQREVAEASAGSVYSVSAVACGEVRRATGFLAGGLVVTNAHIAGGAERLDLSGPGVLASAQVSRVGVGVDLAVAPLGLRGGLTWADDDPAIGDRLVVVGRGSGVFLWRPATVALYGDPAVYGGEGPVLLLDASTEPGFSGGAVLDLDGEVVGVLRAVDTATGLAVAEPVSSYRDWVARDKYGDQKTSC